MKIRWEHAGDGAPNAAHGERTAGDGRVAAKAAVPQTAGDYGDAGRPRAIFIGGEESSRGGFYAKNTKKIRRNASAGITLSLAITRQVCTGAEKIDGGDGGEAPAVLFPEARFGRGNAAADYVAAVQPVQHDDAIGMRVGQRPQQDSVNHREDGGVGANAQGERE